MKKIVMTLGIWMLCMTGVHAQSITLNINNKIVPTKVAPIQESGTTLVPLRVIGEELGAVLGWDGSTQTVTITKGKTVIKLVIGSKRVTVNGEGRDISLAPRLSSSTTMVPLRFIGENLDSQVHWDSNMQTVIVTQQGVNKPISFIKNNKVVIDKRNFKALFHLNLSEAEDIFGSYEEVWFGQYFTSYNMGMYYEEWDNYLLPGSARFFKGSEFMGLDFTETPAQVQVKLGKPQSEGISDMDDRYNMLYNISGHDIDLYFQNENSILEKILAKPFGVK